MQALAIARQTLDPENQNQYYDQLNYIDQYVDWSLASAIFFCSWMEILLSYY